MASYPSSLRQAILYFREFENCRRFMVDLRWPDGKVKCPTCGSQNVTYLKNARLWKCYGKHPRAKFSLKVGTIFEDSPIGLDKWLPAMWLLANCKNGVSSYELADALEVTQKTAWFMLQRLRLAMQDRSASPFAGPTEVDETYIGGAARFMHADKRKRLGLVGTAGKAAVMGLLERHGKVRLFHIANTDTATLDAKVRQNVEKGAEVFTDDHSAYRLLESEYTHNVINHAEAYAKGNVHTNGIENFWSLLKRCLKGTYISVEPFHLFRYLDEQVFRFNNRKAPSADRFSAALRQTMGRRVTYQELTGKLAAEPAPL